MLVTLIILFALLCTGIVYELNQSAVRISRIQIFGADQALADVVREAMQGNYFGIIPRDSTFFFPTSAIRSSIINKHPSIAAVSIFRNGLTGLSVKINDRVSIARWCGSSSSSQTATSSCYVFDANGYLFAVAATSTPTLNTFVLFAPLEDAPSEPLRAILAQEGKLPSVFDFARGLATRGSPTTHIVIHDDEVDNFLASGTRITYVLGHEHDAYTALVSASGGNINLADGSVDYVDLRFDGKVYFKKK